MVAEMKEKKRTIIIKPTRLQDNSDKIAYLQLIQEPICRMSTMSSIFKGFSATIVAGIAMITYKDINVWILALSFLPVLSFLALDLYYLTMERKFRFLYEQVRTDKQPIDFSLKLTKNPIEIILAKARVWDCLKSPSIWLFYTIMIAVPIVVVILKVKVLI